VVRSSRSCRFCASRQVVGYGTTSRGIQRVLCRNCKKVSQISEAPRDGWAYPNKLISEALTLYYDGITIGQMKQKIEEQFGAKPDNSTFYRWIVYYTGMAARMLDLGPIMLGPEWILDEVRLDEKLEKTQEEVGDGELVWYCFDLETRFLISAQWLYGASSKRVDRKSRLIEFLEDAIKSSKRMPKSLISDNLPDQILKSRWCRLSESLVIRSGIKISYFEDHNMTSITTLVQWSTQNKKKLKVVRTPNRVGPYQ